MDFTRLRRPRDLLLIPRSSSTRISNLECRMSLQHGREIFLVFIAVSLRFLLLPPIFKLHSLSISGWAFQAWSLSDFPFQPVARNNNNRRPRAPRGRLLYRSTLSVGKPQKHARALKTRVPSQAERRYQFFRLKHFFPPSEATQGEWFFFMANPDRVVRVRKSVINEKWTREG